MELNTQECPFPSDKNILKDFLKKKKREKDLRKLERRKASYEVDTF